MIPSFYATVTGLSLTTIGITLLLARLADTITDPLIGVLSDKSPARLGRRRIWVIAAAPLLCVATWFLFNPSPSAGTVYLLGWATALYAAGTMIVVPLNAWGAELSPLYYQRSRVTSVRALFGLIGTLSALGLPVLLISRDNAVLSDSLGLITQLILLSTFIALFWTVLIVPDQSVTHAPRHTLKATWSLLVQPSPFRKLVASFLLNGIANAIPATLFLFYLGHVIGAPDMAGKLLFLYFICSTISIPLWLRLSKIFGKHQTWMAAMAIACCFFLWTPLLDTADLYWYALIVALTGFMIGADLILPTAIMGDLIEWDALKTGYRRPGLFFALWGTTTKLAFALAVGSAFPILDLIGFNANPVGDTDASRNSINSSFAISGLAILYGVPCIFFKILAILNLRAYPITQQRHQLIREELERRDIQ